MNGSDRCTGVILAGGLARRFSGRPKGLESVHGMRLIDRVALALTEVTDDLLLVANDPGATDWLPGVRVTRDLLPGNGSLGGVHAALATTGGPVLVVAWDMPFVHPDVLRALRGLGATADAVLPESDSRRGLEPLCAWYSPACLGPISRRLAAGDRRMVGFHDEIKVARLPLREVHAIGDPALLFLNINDPDDLLRAESLAAAPADRQP